jgi:hypothetical protein
LKIAIGKDAVLRDEFLNYEIEEVIEIHDRCWNRLIDRKFRLDLFTKVFGNRVKLLIEGLERDLELKRDVNLQVSKDVTRQIRSDSELPDVFRTLSCTDANMPSVVLQHLVKHGQLDLLAKPNVIQTLSNHGVRFPFHQYFDDDYFPNLSVDQFRKIYPYLEKLSAINPTPFCLVFVALPRLLSRC